jgi:hypothetical protein
LTRQCLLILENLGRPREPGLSAHVAACQHCQAVVKAHETLARARSMHLSQAADAAFAQSLSRAASRPARAWWMEGLAIGAVNLLVVAAGVWALRSRVAVKLAPPEIVWAIGFLLVAAIIAGPLIALAPGGRLLRKYALASFPLLAAAVVVGGSGFQPLQNWMRAGISCLVLEITLSVLPAIFVVWALTTTAFRISRAAIAGLSAGAVGALALHLHCPFGTVSHLLCFHVLPWLGLGAAAVAVRSWLTSKSFAP